MADEQQQQQQQDSTAAPLSGATVESDEIQILGEIVGAYNLSHAGNVQGVKDKHLQPYCIVKFQDKTIHFSSPCTEKGRDPIWTVSSGSLFLFKVSSPGTLLRDKLQISIWSKRNSSSLRGKVLLDMETLFLGKASIDGRTLLSNCNEQRVELPLLDLHGNQSMSESNLAVRFRLATKSDIKLLNLLREQGISPPKLSDASFRQSESRLLIEENPVKDLILSEGSKLPIAPVVTEANESKLAGEYFVEGLSWAFRANTTSDRATGLRKVRAKPFPDPAREEETEFMTQSNISKETMKPSQQWVEAGSGHIGTLHLEILSCHDLPNVDVGEAVGNLSDCFVCAVFEDVMVQTPVIDDELSPHWLPWTQRAFRIGIVHPASTLYLGVLDYDLGPGTHEPIGRAAVNLCNLQSNMTYTLTYNLHPTAELADRTVNGSITVRLRIEYKDEKAAILAALHPRPIFHVNTRKHKTFKVVRYTCFGEYDIEEKFAWPVTKSYIGEILEYWRGLKFYVGQAFTSLVFWRGQVEICNMRLPIHSAVLFTSLAVLVEKPWLIVPFYSLFVAWFLLATMSHRRATPSPWRTCNSFIHYAELILLGKASDTRERIRKSELWGKTQEYDREMSEWRERYQSSIDEKAAMDEKLLNIGNENISTAVAVQLFPVDLLEKLGRYQGTVGRLCTKLRTLKSVIIWEESMTSFWITAVCLVFGLVALLLPWRFILYHGGRTIVWGFLGPHMRLVDGYLQSSSQEDEKAVEEFRKQSRVARIRREEAVKLKDMKCLAYGEYVTLIPAFNLPRHYDRPLHVSTAISVAPGAEKDNTPASSRIPGQQLYGSMIPHTKSGFMSLQDEAKEAQVKLAALEEQISRLQSIEKHVSTRALRADLDNELPDDLGYEVTMCADTCETGQEKGVPSRMPSDFKIGLSVSQTGFETNQDKAEYISVDAELKQGLSKPSRRIIPQRISEEEKKSWDMEDSGNSGDGEKESFDGHHETKVSFLTPLQTHPVPGDDAAEANAEMPFNAPEQSPQHTHKTEEPKAESPLRFLELQLNELSCSPTAMSEPPTTQHHSIAGPRRKDAAAQESVESKAAAADGQATTTKTATAGVADRDDEHNVVTKTQAKVSLTEEEAVMVRRTWSSSDLKQEKTWIKPSPTDSLLHCKAARRRSTLKLEEGLEVVAMGRLRTVGDETAEEDSGDAINDEGGVSDESSSSHRGLSVPFESSEHVQVATCRP